MKAREKRRFPRPKMPRLNIGMGIFFIILIYILFSVITYVTSGKTEVYEVRMGTLSNNVSFRGIALRQESLVKSKYTGKISYFNREGDRIRVGGLAYAIDEEKDLADYADPDMLAKDYYTGRDLAQFRNRVISFVSGFSPSRFYTVYDFKTASASQAQKISNRAILAGIKKADAPSLHTVKAKETGSIVYSYDNYNGMTFKSLSAKDFDSSACKKAKLRNGEKVSKGKPAYRLVSDNNWSVAVMTDDKKVAENLIGEDYVEVRFLKNDATSWAQVDSRQDRDGHWFFNLSFTNSMEAFCMDRFVDIEILSNEKKGLKVPNSSITEGEFFLVPKDYVCEGSNGQQGVLVRYYKDSSDADTSTTRFIASVPYSEADDEYYLDNTVLKEGMILEKEDSQDQFTLGKKKKLKGVYYINKGYPDFRQVTVDEQNDEYALVSPDALYGLQEYDYVVLHADKIRLNNY